MSSLLLLALPLALSFGFFCGVSSSEASEALLEDRNVVASESSLFLLVLDVGTMGLGNGANVLFTHALCTLALACAGFDPVCLLGSRFLGNAGRGLFARRAGVGCGGGDREVRRGTGCFGFFTDLCDTLRDCSRGGTLDTRSLSHDLSMEIVRIM